MKKAGLLVLIGILLYCLFAFYMSPTRIIVVNALKSQQADIALSNDHPKIKVDCIEAEDMGSLDGYDAIVIYARRLFLTTEQEAEVKRVAESGIPIYTKTLRSNDFVERKAVRVAAGLVLHISWKTGRLFTCRNNFSVGRL